MVDSKKIKIEFTIWFSNSISRHIPSKTEIEVSERDFFSIRVHCSTTHNSQWADTILVMDKWTHKMWYINTVEYYSALKRKEILICATTCIMNEPWAYYAKWNKPDTEAQILHDSTHMKYLDWSNSQRQKVASWEPGAGGRMGGMGR